jgi:hypothetical protein
MRFSIAPVSIASAAKLVAPLTFRLDRDSQSV